MSDVINPMTYAECVEWIAALRSGSYLQGIGMLYDGGKYCCLGVEKAIHREQCIPVTSQSDLGDRMARWVRLPHVIQTRLIVMNDSDIKEGGRSFAGIADYIEREILPHIALQEARV